MRKIGLDENKAKKLREFCKKDFSPEMTDAGKWWKKTKNLKLKWSTSQSSNVISFQNLVLSFKIVKNFYVMILVDLSVICPLYSNKYNITFILLYNDNYLYLFCHFHLNFCCIKNNIILHFTSIVFSSVNLKRFFSTTLHHTGDNKSLTNNILYKTLFYWAAQSRKCKRVLLIIEKFL